MTIPRRGCKELLGEEELVGLDGLLNLTFFIPMRLPMLRREVNFFVTPGGNK